MKGAKLWYSTCHWSRQSCCAIQCGVERIELARVFSSLGFLKLLLFPLGLQLLCTRTVVLVGQYPEWLPCCPDFQIFFPSPTSAFFPEFLLCGQSILCSLMTVVFTGFHMAESLMSLMETVTSGCCFAVIYLFTYGKQVTNSIGHLLLLMQSVLLLHCPPF